MAQKLASLLERTIETEYPVLLKLQEEIASRAPRLGAWSPKEELGHLIDSASNNHIRFVRGALEDAYRGTSYAQNEWVRLHGYREMPWPSLVVLWLQLNALLTRLVERIPEERLGALCFIGEVEVTLGFLIEDYVLHMQHHIDHIVSRDRITPYPANTSGV